MRGATITHVDSFQKVVPGLAMHRMIHHTQTPRTFVWMRPSDGGRCDKQELSVAAGQTVDSS